MRPGFRGSVGSELGMVRYQSREQQAILGAIECMTGVSISIVEWGDKPHSLL